MILALLAPLLCAPSVNDGTGWMPSRLDLEVVVLPAERRIVIEGELELVLEAESSHGPWVGTRSNVSLEFVEASLPASVELDRPHPTNGDARVAQVRLREEARRGARVRLHFAGESIATSSQLDVSDEAALASWTTVWYPIPAGRPSDSTSTLCSAPGTTRLHLPAGWGSLSNGRLIEREESAGGVVETWELVEPVARSFAAGPFTSASHTVGERSISVHRLGEKGEEPARQAAVLVRVLEALESRLGPYPYSTYGIAEVPESLGQFGASSEQGFIMVKPQFFGWPDGNLALFGHEMGHAWWGNRVGTTGRGSILCSESLAQYGAVLVIEALEGDEAATRFLRFSRPGYIPDQCAEGYFDVLRRGQDIPLAQLRSGGVHHTLSDAKGHWMYHMLRQRVGDAAFFATLNGILEDFAGKELSLDALRATFLAAAPDARLEAFFEQWLERTGAPDLELTWHATKAGASARITQAQQGEVYDLDVELDLVGAGGERTTHIVRVDERSLEAALDAPFEVTQVELDPRHRILRWTPEYGPRIGATEDEEQVERWAGELPLGGRLREVQLVLRGDAVQVEGELVASGDWREQEATLRRVGGKARLRYFDLDGERVDLSCPTNSRLLTGSSEAGDFFLLRCAATPLLDGLAGFYATQGGPPRLVVPGAHDNLLFFEADERSSTLGTRWPATDGSFFRWNAAGELDERVVFERDAAGAGIASTWMELGGEERRLERVPGPYSVEVRRYAGADGTALFGLLFLPHADVPVPGVSWIHGSGANTTDDGYDLGVCDRLARKGLAVLLPDKRGCGRAAGDWRSASLETLAEDALAGLEVLRAHARVDASHVGLAGISQGGRIAPFAATLGGNAVAFAINLSGGVDALTESGMYEIERMAVRAGLDEVQVSEALALQEFAIAYGHGEAPWSDYERALDAALTGPWSGRGVAEGFPRTREDWKWAWYAANGDFEPLDHWRTLRIPVLACFGTEDHLVDGPTNAAALRHALETAGHPDATVDLDEGLGHALSIGVVDRVAGWIHARH